MADPLVTAGAYELLAVLVTGLVGATGLWRWVAGRIALADKEVADLRLAHTTSLTQIGELRAEVASLSARLETAERYREHAEKLRRERDASRLRTARLERRLIALGEEVTDPDETGELRRP